MSNPGGSSRDGPVTLEIESMVSAWARGLDVSAREVIARRPDLDSEAVIRLIYEETCLRREAGQKVDTAEVIGSYPDWENELLALLDCDRLIRSPRESADSLNVGDILGPFVLLDELGRGASGRTFLASDPALADRPVVVKVIPDDQDEHLALARLRHTYIVPLFSEHTFADRGLRGLCMPFLGGASLSRILDDLADVPMGERSGRLLVEVIDDNRLIAPDESTVDGPFRRLLASASYERAMTWIAACLAEALHYAHERGLVHMDLKPSNVLISVDGQPLLLDFHLARGPIPAGLVVDGRIGGTPGWTSPEQQEALLDAAANRPIRVAVDGRSDVFALGLLLRETLGGPGMIRGSAVGCGLSDIIKKCLAPSPKDRYPDAAALADDLRRELDDLPLRGVRNRSPRERWRKWRRRRPGALAWFVVAFAASLTVGVAMAASLVVYRQTSDQLRVLLEEGRRDRAGRRFAEAIRTLERGLVIARSYPTSVELKKAMIDELRLAERGRLADDLHDLADRIRFRHGVEMPSRVDGEALLRLCRVVWDHGNQLLDGQGPTLDRDSERTIRTDLLELAAIGADLLIYLAATEGSADARQDALRMLDEAELACGPSFIINARRKSIGGVTQSSEEIPTKAPRSAFEHYERGRYALRAGQIEAAAEDFRLSIESRPQDFWPNFYHGLCGFRLGRFEDAAADFRVCIVIAPEVAICHYNRALAFDSLGRIAEARRGYSRAIELDPGLAAALLNRGILSYKNGRIAEAIADFNEGLASRPDRETRGRLRYNLALAQLASRDRQSALSNAEEAAGLGCSQAVRLLDELR